MANSTSMSLYRASTISTSQRPTYAVQRAPHSARHSQVRVATGTTEARVQWMAVTVVLSLRARCAPDANCSVNGAGRVGTQLSKFNLCLVLLPSSRSSETHSMKRELLVATPSSIHHRRRHQRPILRRHNHRRHRHRRQ